MTEGNDYYSAFVEEFTTIEHQGYDVWDPEHGWRHFYITGAVYAETGQLDIGVVRCAAWWRRMLWRLRWWK